jgi:hypothetical protein
MRNIIPIAGALTCLAIAGCRGEPRIDASSDAALEKSLQAVRDSVPQTQRGDLAKAIMKVSSRSAPQGAAADKKPSQAEMFKSLDGKTAKEIMQEAESITDSPKGKTQ